MDVRTFLSSLTGLETFPNHESSHKWLGYFQNVPVGRGGWRAGKSGGEPSAVQTLCEVWQSGAGAKRLDCGCFSTALNGEQIVGALV